MTDEGSSSATDADARFVFQRWHDCLAEGDAAGFLDLYAEDVVFESPLVPRLLDRPEGVVRGRDALAAFFVRAALNPPAGLIKGYRTGRFSSTAGHCIGSIRA